MMKKNKKIDTSLFILIAKVGRTRGLKGEFFVRSFSENSESLISFKKFFILTESGMVEVFFEYIKQSNANIIAKFKSIDDIEKAKSFVQRDLYILRSELPELDKNDAYWFELEKMTVINLEGQKLGYVRAINNFGANDVLEVVKNKKSILIPFIKNRIIISIDKEKKSILVDWQEDY